MRQEPGKGTEAFYIFADPEMASKWRKDSTIPLAQVVSSFNVYTTDNGGITGLASAPSKGVLEDTFGTSNDDEVCRIILEKGEINGQLTGVPSRDETKDPYTMGNRG
ncbi:hypothetical protein IWQ60_010812 [Tieghemiomyces parasiticus]|uniref:Ribosome maturation protein SDO1/SBDS N-terminal domain-containing protein n=1 Tax=Tieghemiomyces parasiticus TaxID=78921 RepID=A0A9W7ZQH6_9FUNG|nr:hypothetical protein IWQ60_010812 [Tieghemiomyces parasiticus]